jgi:hypothetical protein
MVYDFLVQGYFGAFLFLVVFTLFYPTILFIFYKLRLLKIIEKNLMLKSKPKSAKLKYANGNHVCNIAWAILGKQ